MFASCNAQLSAYPSSVPTTITRLNLPHNEHICLPKIKLKSMSEKRANASSSDLHNQPPSSPKATNMIHFFEIFFCFVLTWQWSGVTPELHAPLTNSPYSAQEARGLLSSSALLTINLKAKTLKAPRTDDWIIKR